MKTLKQKHVSKGSKISNVQKGYSLVELIVALSIFGIIVTVAAGAFLASLEAHRRVVAEKEIAENVDFALEFMSRKMRVASKGDGTCIGADTSFEVNGTSEITFIDSQGNCTTFRLDDDGDAIVVETAEARKLTDDTAVSVDELQFIVRGASDTDNEQPRVTIVVEASSVDEETIAVETQTTVSTRRIDVP